MPVRNFPRKRTWSGIRRRHATSIQKSSLNSTEAALLTSTAVSMVSPTLSPTTDHGEPAQKCPVCYVTIGADVQSLIRHLRARPHTYLPTSTPSPAPEEDEESTVLSGEGTAFEFGGFGLESQEGENIDDGLVRRRRIMSPRERRKWSLNVGSPVDGSSLVWWL